MKNNRQIEIKRIIARQTIETQSELTQELIREGFKVTQATVSRDIKDLMLVKVPDASGHYRYVLPKGQENAVAQEKILKAMRSSVLSINQSGNLVVIKTLPGSAAGVAYAIDCMEWVEVLGTVAGDDTVFVCLNSAENFSKLREHFYISES